MWHGDNFAAFSRTYAFIMMLLSEKLLQNSHKAWSSTSHNQTEPLPERQTDKQTGTATSQQTH